MRNLVHKTDWLAHVATTAAGTTTINGTTLDMEGYDGVLFVVQIGTAAADNLLKAQGSSEADGGSPDAFSDLVGSSIGASVPLMVLDVYRPKERYIRAVVTRGTSTTIDCGLAIRYGARKMPCVNDVATVIASAALASPAEGTA